MKKNVVRVFAPGTVANMGCGFDVMGMTLNGAGDILTVSVSEGDGLVIENKSEVELPTDIDKNVITPAVRALMNEFGEPHIKRGYLVLNGEPFKADMVYEEIYRQARKSIYIFYMTYFYIYIFNFDVTHRKHCKNGNKQNQCRINKTKWTQIIQKVKHFNFVD